MACAHAKLSGDVGVCLATSGPGAIHLLNGLYDAKLDHQPVVAIVGQQKTISIGSSYQQEVDLSSLFKDVASEYVQVVMAPGQTTHVIDRAVQIARATRSVTAVIIPSDVQEETYEAPPREHGTTYSGGAVPRPRVIPQREDLQRAAEILNAGEKVAVLVGAGAREAGQELEELAELLGAGVAKALNGKDVLPDDLPYVTGAIGLLGTKPSDVLMQQCDTLLMVGSSFPYSEWLPEPGQARGVQIDLDARRLGIRYPMEVNLAGDARDTLRELLPLLRRQENRSFQDQLMEENDRWRGVLAGQADVAANPLNPLKVFHELSPRLPDSVIVTADSGSSTNWYARHLRFRRGMRGALSGTLATMGPALPYALAAKFVHPDRPVIAIEGDGAMQMNGLNALIDVAKHRHRWTDPRFVVVVLNNRDLNQVTWEQRVLVGDAKLEASQVIPDFPYARLRRTARLQGHPGRRARAGGGRVGGGAGVRGPGGAGGGDRSGGPAAAAAHHVRAGQAPRSRARTWRSGPRSDHPASRKGQTAGVRQPLIGHPRENPCRPVNSTHCSLETAKKIRASSPRRSIRLPRSPLTSSSIPPGPSGSGPSARRSLRRRLADRLGGDDIADNREYVEWLVEQSMLHDANRLAKQLSGSGGMWQNPFAHPDPRAAVERASVWFTAYPLSFVTGKGETLPVRARGPRAVGGVPADRHRRAPHRAGQARRRPERPPPHAVDRRALRPHLAWRWTPSSAPRSSSGCCAPPRPSTRAR